MNTRLIVTSFIILFGFHETAQSEIYAAGPTYGGNVAGLIGGTVTCRVFNYGLSSVSISQRQIWTNTYVLVAPASDTCNVALPPNKYCAFGATIAGNFAYSCRLVAAGVDAKLSGVAEIMSSSGAIMNSQALQK